MIDQGEITDDYNKHDFYRSAAISFAVALVFFVILYIPKLIALGWVWILSYAIGFCVVYIILGKYMQLRVRIKELRKTAQDMLDETTNKRKGKSKRK